VVRGDDMTDTRYAPPTASVTYTDPPSALERPAVVVLAVRLLWSGFAVSFVTSIYGLFVLPWNGAFGVILAMTLLGLAIATAISYAIFSAAWRGRGWARWVLGVLVVLGLVAVALIWKVFPPQHLSIPWQSSASFCIRMALYTVALAMLFSPSANAWYRDKARRP
jgi:hypothetical protein